MENSNKNIDDIEYELRKAQGFEQMYNIMVDCNGELRAQIVDLKAQNDKYKDIIKELSMKIQILKDIIVENEVCKYENRRDAE